MTGQVSSVSKNNQGVRGISHAAQGGVVGVNDWPATGQPPGSGGNGGWFESLQGEGVRGWAKNPNHGGVAGVNTAGGIGVFGQSDKGVGVWGESQSDNQPGVFGKSTKWQGVSGNSTDQAGVVGVSTNFVGVWGESQSGNQPGVFGHFEGNVEVKGDVMVTGDIKLINADCAEDFNIGADVSIAPGTVMVLGEEGALFPSLGAYDKRVAGVISGAGEYKPGIVLDKQPSDGIRQPVALLGKVYCKVDAQYGAIEVGDLLTTSPTPGYAMKADDPLKAFGAVIGKALRPLAAGQDLIPILIALQ